METLRQKIFALPSKYFSLEGICIRPIRDDYDLWYAVVTCKLAPGQEEYVNPAGFSIGRAYLQPENNIPCIIWKDETRIGYIVFRTWCDGIANSANSWSYYLDEAWQGHGYGTIAARLAIQILKAADGNAPIKLSAEKANCKAHHLYCSIGFRHEGELDGDDLVYEYKGDPNDLS